jgi:pimeloyl-ACP methyl ester carboxylesterase
MFLSAHPQATGNMTMPMITIDGGTLSYDVSGAGPPIVFVAGLGEHGTYWMAQVAAFSSAFQVVTFDHGGVGASEGQPPYKVEQWAADTLRLIDHLGLDRVHLVGHSTGGAIAQVLAADHSDRVASLVLGATWRGWTRDCASCSFSASERCTSRWVLIGAARPGTRRRKSRFGRSATCPQSGLPDTDDPQFRPGGHALSRREEVAKILHVNGCCFWKTMPTFLSSPKTAW